MSRQEGVGVTEETHDAPEQSEDSQVGKEALELRGSLEHAEKVLRRLEERLEPVRMPVSGDNGPANGTDEEAVAPLAEEIRTARHRVNHLSLRVKSLLETLAI